MKILQNNSNSIFAFTLFNNYEIVIFYTGEIYTVDDTMLSKLDILEDHPKYYIREIVDIVVKKP